ncbi:MAG TPA: hypothetical protein VHZ33_31015 [Trebonia sp.]|nr:hypothetical protein [Trebonia sp.]
MARIALQLAVPVVLGLVIGLVIAFQAGSSNSGIDQVPLGAWVRPSASAAAPGSLMAAPAANQATTNADCEIIVPADPLTARGLATPYQLTGIDGMTPAQSGCEMSNAVRLGAFVQATILDPATGRLSVYDPLVVTQGIRPAVRPTVPPIPADAVVTIDFGFNGADLIQVGATPATLADADCVSGQAGSAFGQVAFCNGVSFFSAVRKAERAGLLRVPSPGASDKIIPSGGGLGTGRGCPVTRNFEVAGQTSANDVTTEYLLNPLTGQTAQDTTSNAGNMAGATLLQSRSDNTILDQFLDPLLGCTPLQAPDLADNDQPASSQALDEILAGAYQPKIAALAPENEKLLLGGDGALDPAKTNAYRAEFGQAPVGSQTDPTSDPPMYCQNLVDIQTPFLAANRRLLAAGQSPATATGNTLLTYMADRLSQSFTALGCQRFGLKNPVTLVRNAAGAAVAASFATAPQRATTTGAS